LSILLKDIMSFSRVSSEKMSMTEVSLKEVADMALLQLSNRIGERKAQIHVSTDLPNVKGNASSLAQVLQNLRGNAIKFTPQDRQPEIKVFHTYVGKQLRLHVQDNAQGIPKEQLNTIFKAFFKSNDSYNDGTGLGLSIVKKIVDLHGGRVEVQSEVGKGSEFVVMLG